MRRYSLTVLAAAGSALVVAWTLVASAQVAGPGTAQAQQATVETAAIELKPPDRYQVPIVLEPGRRVELRAMADGVVKSVRAGIGETVKAGDELAALDPAEATARLRIAEAEVKQAQGELEAARAQATTAPAGVSVAYGKVDAAKARVDLARIQVERCRLVAPFPGRIVAVPVGSGQFVTKGTILVEVIDTNTLHAMVPVDRTSVSTGATLDLVVEGQPVSSRVLGLLPLPASHAALHELATPWSAAWVSITNTDGRLEPGQRVQGPSLPDAPIAVVAERAVQPGDNGGSVVQVLRDNHVTDIPVRVLGPIGPERLQVSGPLRPTDALIVASSVPLTAGTFLRFEGQPGSSTAGVTPPVAPPRTAPIGAPGSALPKPAARPPATKGARGNAVPF